MWRPIFVKIAAYGFPGERGFKNAVSTCFPVEADLPG
jgi:hypothetical protein